jgi:rhamnose utilization protein RhaD (predicted bifunctional aldolase and dehydrogenase)
MDSLLKILTETTRKFGSDKYVKGGGGNSSVKTKDTIWVKPSGSTMGTITADKFVALERAKILRMDDVSLAGDAKKREALAKEIMAAAVMPDSTGRPSVEAPLHNLLETTYVIHTHPALVNGMTCAKNGEEVCKKLFPQALWMSYIDPGITLYQVVRDKVAEYKKQFGKQPQVIFLKNHGVFVAGDTPEIIEEIYDDIFAKLENEYAKANISLILKEQNIELKDQDTEAFKKAFPADEMQAVISTKSFVNADEAISPDHIVYMKSFVHKGDISEQSILDFKETNGYYPKILETPGVVYSIGPNLAGAYLALELAKDAALIKQLAEAFGGINYLDDASRDFIENWEVESYRRKQMA